MYLFSTPSHTLASYTTLFWLQLFSIGQFSFLLRWQLHPPSFLSLVLLLSIFWLCPLMIWCIFLVHEYETLIVFLFSMQCKGLSFGKCLDTSLRKRAPMFVVTTLASYIWEAGLNPEPKIQWSILKKATPYKKGGRSCDLCLTEKLLISKNFQNPQYLNQRTELALKCRHKRSYLLSPREG